MNPNPSPSLDAFSFKGQAHDYSTFAGPFSVAAAVFFVLIAGVSVIISKTPKAVELRPGSSFAVDSPKGKHFGVRGP